MSNLKTASGIVQAMYNAVISKDGIPGPKTYETAARLAYCVRVTALVEARAEAANKRQGPNFKGACHGILAEAKEQGK